MKKLILTLSVAFQFLYSQGMIESFEHVDSLFMQGWEKRNNSSPAGSGEWRQDFGNFDANFGPDNSSIVCDYQSIASGQAGDISNWLITPTLNLTNGDSIIIHTMSYQNGAFPDRMEIRMNVSNTIDVGMTTTSVGDFDTLLFTINPTLTTGTGGYPMIWVRYAIGISGLPTTTPSRIGFRYYVTNGGQSGTNGSTIGIDRFEHKSVLIGIENEKPLTAFMSITNEVLNVNVPDADKPFALDLMDVSGRILHSGEYLNTASLPLQEFNSRILLVRIVYEGKFLVKKISF